MEQVQVYHGDGDALVLLEEEDPMVFREAIDPLPTYSYTFITLPGEDEPTYRVHMRGKGLDVRLSMGKQFWEELTDKKNRVQISNHLMWMIREMERESRPLTGI